MGEGREGGWGLVSCLLGLRWKYSREIWRELDSKKIDE